MAEATGPFVWMHQVTQNVALYFSAASTEEDAMFRVGVNYNYAIMETMRDILTRCMWVTLVFIPIFYTIRMRLYPYTYRTRDNQVWEAITHFLYACADAFVMAVATDRFQTGNAFEVAKGLLMLVWFIWMYEVIAAYPPTKRFV
ncbi:hypothetical protein F4805DRAFT_452533 [Annulohypoxylon moriforme]|nr:hypothetical protein F4805DRAFT_452533 [Annulohypoxylon moriforme]